MPPHMQIDANDMQMSQSKPGFARVLCQAASYGVQPGLLCARSSHLGPRGLGVNIRLRLLQKAFQDPAGRSPSPSPQGLEPASGLCKGATISPSRQRAPKGRAPSHSPLHSWNFHRTWHQVGAQRLQTE